MNAVPSGLHSHAGSTSDNEVNEYVRRVGIFKCHRLLFQNGTTVFRIHISSCISYYLSNQVRHEGPLALYKGMSGLALFAVPRFALMWYFKSNVLVLNKFLI